MKKMALRIRSSYEATRLSEVYLSDAYEKLIPIIKRNISKNKKNIHKIKVTTELKRKIT
jgi:tRNA G26 N,N-dimethylase Trm1